MINPTTRWASIPESARTPCRELQLFEPPPDAIYTIEATSRLVDVSRRTILVYCKHHLLSPATATIDHGYYFDRDAIRALRRIEALRTVCGDDLAGIKIILELTAALERLRSDIRLLSRAKSSRSAKKSARNASTISSPRINVKSKTFIGSRLC
jgi:DNA-binding transcriptional MerR regulator